MLGNILGAATGIIGGLIGKSSANDARKQAVEDAKNRGTYAREDAARSGFNPLTLLNAGAGVVAPSFGPPPLSTSELIFNGFKDVAKDLVDYWEDSKKDEQSKLAQIDAENPNFMRLHAPNGTDFVPESAWANRPDRVGSVGFRKPPLGPQDGKLNPATPLDVDGGPQRWLAGDREVERAPWTDAPGFTSITNPLFGGTVVVPGSDGEPWDLGQNLSVLMYGGPQIVRNHWNNLAPDLSEYKDAPTPVLAGRNLRAAKLAEERAEREAAAEADAPEKEEDKRTRGERRREARKGYSQ